MDASTARWKAFLASAHAMDKDQWQSSTEHGGCVWSTATSPFMPQPEPLTESCASYFPDADEVRDPVTKPTDFRH